MVILNQSFKDTIKPNEAMTGEIVTFLNGGEFIENTRFPYPDGNPRKDFFIKVKYKGEVKNIKVNKYSRDEIMKEYGADTEKWIGKQAQITVEVVRSLNKKCIILTPFQPEKKEKVINEALKLPETQWPE